MTHTKDCVLFSTADWNTPYWTNKQHTARYLARRGYRVLYVESIGLRAPTADVRDIYRILLRIKRGLKWPQQVEHNVWVMSPIAVPFKQHWPIFRIINQSWLALGIGVFKLIKNFKRPLIWTYHPFILEVIAKITHSSIVYHCVDDLSAIPGINSVAFNKEEERLLKKSQAVFVTSLALKEKCSKFNDNIHYFPNVVDFEHFNKKFAEGNEPQDLSCIPHPRVGYVGALSDYKIDFNLIYSTANLRKDLSWILIGEQREGQYSPWMQKLKSLPNVYFLGKKQYSELPLYLRYLDVGTLPTLINEYTRSMFPMKYFEYISSGLRVVSTALEFTKFHNDGVRIGANANEFSQAINSQLKMGRLTDEESKSYVGDNTWEMRLKKMIDIVNLDDEGQVYKKKDNFGYMKPILAALILPPLNIILLGMIGVMQLVSGKHFIVALAFIMLVFVLLWIFCSNATAILLSRKMLPQIKPLSPNELVDIRSKYNLEAIVVLGGGVELDHPEYGEAQLTNHSAATLRYAIYLYHRTKLPIAFAGGLGWAHIQDNSPSEAEVALRISRQEYGVSFQWIDTVSRDTKGNAAEMRQQLGEEGIQNILLVTNPLQMPRAILLFEENGFNVYPAPIGFINQQERKYLEWLPSGHGLTACRNVMREWVALVVAKYL
jgi:uncharacterized SAM-binding protein YcdF (DUF218 family)